MDIRKGEVKVMRSVYVVIERESESERVRETYRERDTHIERAKERERECV